MASSKNPHRRCSKGLPRPSEEALLTLYTILAQMALAAREKNAQEARHVS